MERSEASRTARIIFTRSGRGLVKDAQLLASILEQEGWQVFLNPVTESHVSERFTYYWERAKIRLPKGLKHLMDRYQMAVGKLRTGRTDLQIHLEIPFSTFIGNCAENWLIPNQEWANMHQLQYLPFLSRILCKTHAATEAYSSFNSNVVHIGFSNQLAAAPPKFDESSGRFQRFLHVAGNNQKKGSKAVIDAWRANPQWPNLNFVVEDPSRFFPIPDNVTVRQSISDEELNDLRKSSGIVLAPSEVEGFGHVILEAMAWGAVTVTTDAEPMNELVEPDHGFLVAWSRSEPCRLGHRYFVAPQDLSTVVDSILACTDSQLAHLAAKGRESAQSNHQRFETAFKNQLATTGKSGL